MSHRVGARKLVITKKTQVDWMNQSCFFRVPFDSTGWGSVLVLQQVSVTLHVGLLKDRQFELLERALCEG